MYAKDRRTPRILTRYTRRRKSSLSLSLSLSFTLSRDSSLADYPSPYRVLDFHASTRDDERKAKFFVEKRRGEKVEQPTMVVMGRRSRSSLNFQRTVPRSGPVGVVTIDSWPQLFRRLKKERLESLGGGKTSFPDIYFCLFKGPDNSHPSNNMGSFYVFPYTAV